MEEFLAYMNKHWGSIRTCAQCQGDINYICSSCNQTAYCGQSCQSKHWENQHRFECIQGKRERGEGEGEGEEGEGKSKKEREESGSDTLPSPLEPPQRPLETLTYDLWQKMSQFLGGNDLKNLRLSKVLEMQSRRTYFATMRFKITVPILGDPHFKNIKNVIQAVLVDHIDTLSALVNLVDEHQITDVKFVDTFNAPIRLNQFPKNLKYLTFGRDFDQDLGLYTDEEEEDETYIPDTVTHITFGKNFQSSFDFTFFSHENTIVYLDMQKCTSLRKRSPVGARHWLPNGIEVLKLPQDDLLNWIGHDLGYTELKYLYLGKEDNMLPLLPESIVHVEYPANGTLINFEDTLDDVDEEDVQSLFVNTESGKPKFPNLTSLVLPDAFNASLEYFHYLLNLKYLKLGNKFNQPIGENHLNNNLKKLILGLDFRQPLTHIPSNLEYLAIPADYPFSANLPSGLRFLQIGKTLIETTVNGEKRISRVE